MTSEVRERDASATLDSARLKAVTDELASVKLELADSCTLGTSSRLSAHAIDKSASQVENGVSKALMAMSGAVVDATERKVFIIGLEWKDALRRVSTQMEMDSQAVISRTKVELERIGRENLRRCCDLSSRISQLRGRSL